MNSIPRQRRYFLLLAQSHRVAHKSLYLVEPRYQYLDDTLFLHKYLDFFLQIRYHQNIV